MEAMSVEFLSFSMSGLAVQASPGAYRSSDLGGPAATSFARMNFADSPSAIQVRIGWKHILVDVVQRLGGTEPVYICQTTADRMCQSRVSFRLPVDSIGTIFEDIVATGSECSTLCEAESEASVAALKELEHGCLRIRMMDVSDWEDDMHKAEVCYSPMRHKVGANTSGDMCPEVADHFAKVIMAHYLKLKELSAETEKAKAFIDNGCDHVEYLFREASLYQASTHILRVAGFEISKHPGRLPQEIQVSMKLVFQEMMASLRWPRPMFSVVCSEAGLLVCETSVYPYDVHGSVVPKTVTVIGFEASSREAAVESSCKAAISVLESEKSIFLVDLNFRHRSLREQHVTKAKEAMEFFASTSCRVLGQWKTMVDEIHACEEYCWKLVAEHSEQDGNLAHRMENSARDIAGLHKVFLRDFQLGKQRLNNTGWTGQ
ncbi:hypothetical protein ACQ4PT_003760 [Festuca glaucescens]